jgi:hypothetical protein
MAEVGALAHYFAAKATRSSSASNQLFASDISLIALFAF